MNINEFTFDNIDKEVAVIFQREVSNFSNKVILKPVKIVIGHMISEYNLFVDRENNSYSHYINLVPGNVYGLRCSLSELLEKYETSNYTDAKRNWLKDLKMYEYDLVLDDDGKIGLFGISSSGDKQIKLNDDIDLINLKGKLDDGIIIADKVDEKARDDKVINISEVSNAVKRAIIGQNEAVDRLLTTLWTNEQSFRKDNVIMIGQTGSGKTAILNEIAKNMNRHVYIDTAAGLTESGYVGRGITDIINGLIVSCNNDIEKASNAIVVLDEFDKLSTSKGGQIATESVQNELLTLIESGEFLIKVKNEKVLFLTKNITFIGLGNFYGVTKKSNKEVGFGKNIFATEKSYKEVTDDDLIKYGFIPDLIGRMKVIITLNTLTIQDYVNILKNSTNSILQDRINILKQNGIIVIVTEDAYLKMAELAVQSSLGARALDGIVNNTLSCILTDIAFGRNNYNYVVVTEETVINPVCYNTRNVEMLKAKVKGLVKKNEKFRNN